MFTFEFLGEYLDSLLMTYCNKDVAPATAVEIVVELPRASRLEWAFKCDLLVSRFEFGDFGCDLGNCRNSLAVIFGSWIFRDELVPSCIAIKLLDNLSSWLSVVKLLFNLNIRKILFILLFKLKIKKIK